MKNFTTALMTKFNSTTGGVHNNFYNSVSGKLYKERAEQDSALPYAVYHIISSVPDWSFNSDFEDIRIQFDLFSDKNSSSEIEDMYTYLRELFDWCTFTVTNQDLVYMRRALARLVKDPVDDVWMYTVDYEIKLHHVASLSPSASPSLSPSASASPSVSPSKSPSISPSASPSEAP